VLFRRRRRTGQPIWRSSADAENLGALPFVHDVQDFINEAVQPTKAVMAAASVDLVNNICAH